MVFYNALIEVIDIQNWENEIVKDKSNILCKKVKRFIVHSENAKERI